MIDIARRSLVVSVCLLALTVLVASGCSSDTEEQAQPLPAPAQPAEPAYARLSPTPPPAPIPETAPMMSDPQHEAWRPGYWSYDNGQFDWVPGSIIAKPTFTAVWTADHWERREFGWAFVCGYWQ